MCAHDSCAGGPCVLEPASLEAMVAAPVDPLERAAAELVAARRRRLEADTAATRALEVRDALRAEEASVRARVRGLMEEADRPELTVAGARVVLVHSRTRASGDTVELLSAPSVRVLDRSETSGPLFKKGANVP